MIIVNWKYVSHWGLIYRGAATGCQAEYLERTLRKPVSFRIRTGETPINKDLRRVRLVGSARQCQVGAMFMEFPRAHAGL